MPGGPWVTLHMRFDKTDLGAELTEICGQHESRTRNDFKIARGANVAYIEGDTLSINASADFIHEGSKDVYTAPVKALKRSCAIVQTLRPSYASLGIEDDPINLEETDSTFTNIFIPKRSLKVGFVLRHPLIAHHRSTQDFVFISTTNSWSNPKKSLIVTRERISDFSELMRSAIIHT